MGQYIVKPEGEAGSEKDKIDGSRYGKRHEKWREAGLETRVRRHAEH